MSRAKEDRLDKIENRLTRIEILVLVAIGSNIANWIAPLILSLLHS